MTENWIKEIAESIKEKNHVAATQSQENERKSQIVMTTGRGFHSDTCALIETYAQAMMNSDIMKNDVTRGNFIFGSVRDSFTFFRPAFPFLLGKITFQEHLWTIQVSFRSGTPDDSGRAVQDSTYKFAVGENDGVYVTEEYGESARKFNTPSDLAQHILKQMMAG